MAALSAAVAAVVVAMMTMAMMMAMMMTTLAPLLLRSGNVSGRSLLRLPAQGVEAGRVVGLEHNPGTRALRRPPMARPSGTTPLHGRPGEINREREQRPITQCTWYHRWAASPRRTWKAPWIRRRLSATTLTHLLVAAASAT